jgi:nucleoside-triphosphatase
MTRSAGVIPELLTTAKNLLLTGPPGCGKTTVLRRVAERLGDLRLWGFLTLELREHGQRVGFEAIDLHGRRTTLSHIRSRSSVRVGRYGVEPERLIPLVEVNLIRPGDSADGLLIDEIGQMECSCPAFTAAMRRVLEGSVPVLATVALRGGGFIAEVKARPDVRIIEVAPGNRDDLPERLATWLRGQARSAGRSMR